MKKLLLIFCLLFAAKSFAQYPLIQGLGNDSTLIRVGQNYKGGIKGGLINMSVADTTAANLLRIKAYPGAQIYTDDGSVWIRNITATGWSLLGGGVSPSGSFWAIGGNLFPVTVPSRNIGTLSPYGGAIGLMTNSVVHAIVPDAGFTLSNDTTSTKIFTINPTTKEWGYANWNNGGSGGWGYSDTVATLTGSSTVDANSNTFKISNMGTASDFSPFAEGSSLNFGAINDWGDVIIRADSIRFPIQYNSTASDTSLVKPLVISPSGKIGRLISWSLIGGGGGSQNLQQVTDIGNTTTKSIQVGDSLRVQGGTDPFVAMKQATSNQEYRLRVGVGTGLSSQSFSLYDATAAANRMVMTATGNMVLGGNSAPSSHSRILVYGFNNGANIDALPDSTLSDESNIEAMGADYYGSSFPAYGVAMQFNGNANTGSIMNYSKKNFGQLRFTGVTNFLRVIPNASLRFATNNTERMVLDSLGNVGINVQVPSYKFQIEAATGATTTPFYVNDSEDNADYVAQFRKAGVLKTGIGTNGDITMIDMTAPSTPSSGYGVMYVNTDSLRFKNDAGTEFTLGRSSGSGGTPAGSNKQVQYNSSGSFAGAAGVEIGNTNNRLYLQGQATTEVPLIIQAVSSQSADLIQFKNSSGTVKASMISDGSRFGFGQAAQAVDGVVQILNGAGMANSLTWTDGATTGGELKATGSLSSIGTSNTTPFALVYNTSEKLRVDANGTQLNSRLRQAQGADVASANNLSLGTDGNAFEITGTTTINLISNTNWQNGSVIRLVFSSSLTVTNNAGTSGSNINILLAGGANFSATANDILTLMLCEIGSVQNWVEVSRSVN